MSSERYWDYDTELLPLCKVIYKMATESKKITPFAITQIFTTIDRNIEGVACIVRRIINSMYGKAWYSDTNGTDRANIFRKALLEAGFDLTGLPELSSTYKIKGRQKQNKSKRGKGSNKSPNAHIDFSAAFAIVPLKSSIQIEKLEAKLRDWIAVKDLTTSMSISLLHELYPSATEGAIDRYLRGKSGYKFGPPQKFITRMEEVKYALQTI